MNNKKILSTLSLAMMVSLLVFCLTGCGFSNGQDKTIADADGNMLKYSLNELYNSNLEGFYIKNKDKSFSPVMTGMDNYSSASLSSIIKKDDYKSRFIWFSDTETIKLKNLIPRVTKDTPLVGFFTETDSMPEEYYLEKYVPVGYTVGWTFKMAEDQSTLMFNADNACTNSTAALYGTDKELKGEYEVKKFNESEDLPLANIDTPTGLLIGLEKNKPYQVGYYDGTVYYSTTRPDFVLRADTQAFKSAGEIDLGVPFNKSTDNYFEIILPDNLEAGYYYINEFGLFEYCP